MSKPNWYRSPHEPRALASLLKGPKTARMLAEDLKVPLSLAKVLLVRLNDRDFLQHIPSSGGQPSVYRITERGRSEASSS